MLRKILRQPRSSFKQNLLELTEKEKPQSTQMELITPKVRALWILFGLFLALCFFLSYVVYLWEISYGPLLCTPSKLVAFVFFNLYMLVNFHWRLEFWVFFLFGNVTIYFGADYPS